MQKLLRATFAVSFLLLAYPAQAKNMADPQSGCQLSVPDDWTVKNSGDGSTYTALAVSADQSESLSLFVVPSHSPGPLDENSEYVKGFLKSCQDHGATILKRDRQTVNGIDFYVLSISTVPGSTVANMSAWLAVANGNVYQLGLTAKDTDAAKDARLQAAVNSFSVSKK